MFTETQLTATHFFPPFTLYLVTISHQWKSGSTRFCL